MSVITTPGKIRNQACERGPDVLFKELLQVHDRGVILAGEPSMALHPVNIFFFLLFLAFGLIIFYVIDSV